MLQFKEDGTGATVNVHRDCVCYVERAREAVNVIIESIYKRTGNCRHYVGIFSKCRLVLYASFVNNKKRKRGIKKIHDSQVKMEYILRGKKSKSKYRLKRAFFFFLTVKLLKVG